MFELAELYAKQLLGEPLTNDEFEVLKQSHIRYELVRFLYMEKMKAEGSQLTDFHFTPGNNWMNVPVIDIVNELLKFNTAIKEGKVELVDFGDRKLKTQPPVTGIDKTDLK